MHNRWHVEDRTVSTCPVTEQRAPALITVAGRPVVCTCEVCSTYFPEGGRQPNDGLVGAQISTIAHFDKLNNGRHHTGEPSKHRRKSMSQPRHLTSFIPADVARQLYRIEKLKRQLNSEDDL